jgi:hypothetical protein
MEMNANDLLLIIGRQQVEIEALRQQNRQLREMVKPVDLPKSSEESTPETEKDA